MRVRVCAVAYMIGCSVLCSTVMGRVNFYLMRLMMFFDEFDSDPSLHHLEPEMPTRYQNVRNDAVLWAFLRPDVTSRYQRTPLLL